MSSTAPPMMVISGNAVAEQVPMHVQALGMASNPPRHGQGISRLHFQQAARLMRFWKGRLTTRLQGPSCILHLFFIHPDQMLPTVPVPRYPHSTRVCLLGQLIDMRMRMAQLLLCHRVVPAVPAARCLAGAFSNVQMNRQTASAERVAGRLLWTPCKHVSSIPIKKNSHQTSRRQH